MARSTRDIYGDETVHYVSSRKKRRDEKVKVAPPLTPMIDVTFQLLIFFMLTTTFRQAEGQIPATLPKESGGAPSVIDELKRPVKIILHPRGEGFSGCSYEIRGVAGVKSTPDDLFRTLDQMPSKEVPLIIKPRADVRMKFVIEAYNQSVRAKFKNISFE